jgi:inosine-uridine nucleoside N-ribohydrolase
MELSSRGCGSVNQPRTPVILDVDTGIDDALALTLAVRSPGCDLVAVTTLAGNSDVERTTANTLAVLDWIGAEEVPVHRGASRPLVRPRHGAAYFHGLDGLGNAGLPASSRTVAASRGPAAIVQLANARPKELTLVCVGPLTNLAIALNVEPNLPHLLRSVVVMGGAYRVPGNVTPLAEFNIFEDPEAADQVMLASFPDLTLVGLDVTHQTSLPIGVWEQLTVPQGADGHDPVGQLVAKVCREAFTIRGLTRFHLHDPLALAVALDPSLLSTELVAVSVDLLGDQRGRTNIEGAGSTNIGVAVDAERFVAGFVQTLGLPGSTSAAG